MRPPVRPRVRRIVRARRRARSSGEASRKILTSASGKHHRADVAPFHHDAAARAHRALLRDRASSRTPRQTRDGGRRGVDLRRPDRRRRRPRRRRGRRRRRLECRARSPSAATAVFVGEVEPVLHAPSTPPRGTSRPCRRAGSRAARRRRARPCPCPRPDGPSMAMIEPVFRIGSRSSSSRACVAPLLLSSRCARTRTATLTFVAVALVLAPGGRRAPLRPRRRVRCARGWRAGLVGDVASGGGSRSPKPPSTIPWRDGTLRGRRYAPAAADRPAAAARARRPRLRHRRAAADRLRARARRRSAIPTVTAELTDLTHYRITAAHHRHDRGRGAVARRGSPSPSADGRIGIMGISFAGGLSIVAAGRPALRDRVAFVLSFGGHGDLPRTLHYLCDRHAAGRHAPAAARLRRGDHPARRRRSGRAGRPGGAAAGGDPVVPRRRRGSTWSTRPQAAAEFARARTLADALARAVAHADDLRQQSRRRAPRPDPRCRTWPRSAATPALSPDRGAAAARCRSTCCTALDDNVIPAIESALLARDAAGARRHGPLPGHAAGHPRGGRSRRVGVVGASRWSASGPRSSDGLTGRDAARRRAPLRRGVSRPSTGARRGAGRGRPTLAQRRDFFRRELAEIARPQALVGDRADRARAAAARPGGRSHSHILRTWRLRPSWITIDSSVSTRPLRRLDDLGAR